MADLHGNTSGVKIDGSYDGDFEDIRNSIQYRHGMYFTFCTILFFHCINWMIKSQGPPKSLKEDEWKWRNLYVSWIHAFLCAVWTLSSIIIYPELFHNLLTHINLYTYLNVCFSLGYFMYDFIDLAINKKIIDMWEVTLHHVAVAGMFYYNIHIKSNIGFNLIALCVEVNSFFLHWRKLLQMVGTPFGSRQYLVIKYLNLVSFAMFRFGPLIAITMSVFFWRLKVSVFYYVCITLSMIFMDVLNVILFKRLFKSDVYRSHDGKSSTLLKTLRQDFMVILGNVDRHGSMGFNNNVAKTNNDRKTE